MFERHGHVRLGDERAILDGDDGGGNAHRVGILDSR